jgi:hypothetical protein
MANMTCPHLVALLLSPAALLSLLLNLTNNSISGNAITAVNPGDPLTTENVERLVQETAGLDKPAKKTKGFKTSRHCRFKYPRRGPLLSAFFHRCDTHTCLYHADLCCRRPPPRRASTPPLPTSIRPLLACHLHQAECITSLPTSMCIQEHSCGLMDGI